VYNSLSVKTTDTILLKVRDCLVWTGLLVLCADRRRRKLKRRRRPAQMPNHCGTAQPASNG
jgi:hypothetical protein